MKFRKGFTLKCYANKGFTLIELLVVIGLLAVIAAGVIALINPAEKTKQAQDSNAQSAIGQVATALQSYAAQQTTTTVSYPATMAWDDTSPLVVSGELVHMPFFATGYTPVYIGGGATAGVYVNLTSQKYIKGTNYCGATGNSAYWFWTSSNGRACGKCNAAPVITDTCGTW